MLMVRIMQILLANESYFILRPEIIMQKLQNFGTMVCNSARKSKLSNHIHIYIYIYIYIYVYIRDAPIIGQ